MRSVCATSVAFYSRMVSDWRYIESSQSLDIYLVGLVSCSSGDLALVAGRELGEVAVVVTLPVDGVSEHRVTVPRRQPIG